MGPYSGGKTDRREGGCFIMGGGGGGLLLAGAFSSQRTRCGEVSFNGLTRIHKVAPRFFSLEERMLSASFQHRAAPRCSALRRRTFCLHFKVDNICIKELFVCFVFSRINECISVYLRQIKARPFSMKRHQDYEACRRQSDTLNKK